MTTQNLIFWKENDIYMTTYTDIIKKDKYYKLDRQPIHESIFETQFIIVKRNYIKYSFWCQFVVMRCIVFKVEAK